MGLLDWLHNRSIQKRFEKFNIECEKKTSSDDAVYPSDNYIYINPSLIMNEMGTCKWVDEEHPNYDISLENLTFITGIKFWEPIVYKPRKGDFE